MSKLMNKACTILHYLAVLCLTMGTALTMVAMFTSYWQIADFGNGAVYQHGLYRDCSKGSSSLKNGNIDEWQCVWKFDRGSESTADNFFRLYYWQVTVLVLLGTSCILATLSGVSACCTCRLKYCSVPWVLASLFATALSLSGLVVYSRHANDNRVRYYKKGTTEVEQRFGISLILAIAGLVLYAVATTAGAVYTFHLLAVFSSFSKPLVRKDNSYSSSNISNRSMDRIDSF